MNLHSENCLLYEKANTEYAPNLYCFIAKSSICMILKQRFPKHIWLSFKYKIMGTSGLKTGISLKYRIHVWIYNSVLSYFENWRTRVRVFTNQIHSVKCNEVNRFSHAGDHFLINSAPVLKKSISVKWSFCISSNLSCRCKIDLRDYAAHS